MKHRFMSEHRHEFAVNLMCRVLKVARADFYAWLHKPVAERHREDQRLLALIKDSYTGSHGVYGARRVFGERPHFALWIVCGRELQQVDPADDASVQRWVTHQNAGVNAALAKLQAK